MMMKCSNGVLIGLWEETHTIHNQLLLVHIQPCHFQNQLEQETRTYAWFLVWFFWVSCRYYTSHALWQSFTMWLSQDYCILFGESLSSFICLLRFSLHFHSTISRESKHIERAGISCPFTYRSFTYCRKHCDRWVYGNALNSSTRMISWLSHLVHCL